MFKASCICDKYRKLKINLLQTYQVKTVCKMASQIKQKIKHLGTHIKQRIQRNWESVVFWVYVFGLSIPVILVSFFFGLFAVVAKDTMLASLIEAEATVLGFFGLIVVYALTSLDARTDRLEQQIFDITETNKFYKSTGLGEKKTRRDEALRKTLRNVQKKREQIINFAVITGGYLIVSLLLSILALGIPDVTSSFILCSLAVGLFLTAIGGIFGVLHFIAKRPK